MSRTPTTPPTRAKRGRPSSYRAEYAQQARNYCLLGATDPELAGFFGVSLATVKNWKAAHPAFLAALKDGKDVADAAVAQSLYRRALGYSHKAVKIITVSQGANRGSVVEQVPYTERYAPDTTACIFWLKNRKPAQWRDRQEEQAPDAQDTARQVRDALKQMADADAVDAAV